MSQKDIAAALAVAAGQHFTRTLAEHGPDSPEVQEAVALADNALDYAEDAGCTKADYQAARINR
ncbi:hypothetical protein XF35_41070 [Streptomyces platensis subsp. clarensis]|uniref:Uncharacterized protein n=1 Tax=Streptomyces showdoensis TaxID=68268 RepID=A0A2P2GKL7_STREW|nr:hypothetical protein [Streptomyces showdoensis]KKZ72050.1 hypothetical protein VO63_19870 [Streptomyces showdoensis]MCW7991424.1 hypothetical protein [Streptomyces platensis subsp. clarensis]